MRIVFIYPQWTDSVGEIKYFSKRTGVYPPLNLAILGSIAEKKGHIVKIIDGEVNNYDNDTIVEIVKIFDPDMIGITSTTPFFHIVASLTKQLKKELPHIPIIIGGPHITAMGKDAFLPVFDYGFIGESDKSFSMFLDSYNNHNNLSNIPNLVYWKNNKVIYNKSKIKHIDINNTFEPAWHLLDMDKYYVGTKDGIKKFCVIMTVRGCPFSCIFCSTKVFGNNIRRKKPEFVIDEMKKLIDKYGIEHFIFLDDTLTLDEKHITSICDLIIKNKLNITFEGSTRADLLDEKLVRKLKQAGMNRISFGLETVNPTIRNKMKKQVPLGAYITSNHLTDKYDIETINSCMIGLPGETKETIRETLSYLRDNHEIKQANISIAVPYPGTELYDMAINGNDNIELMVDDFSKFTRYNSSVLRVGNLYPDDLIKIQNACYASIYIMPWRWKYVIAKNGWKGWLMTFRRLFRCMYQGGLDLVFIDKKLWRKYHVNN